MCGLKWPPVWVRVLALIIIAVLAGIVGWTIGLREYAHANSMYEYCRMIIP